MPGEVQVDSDTARRKRDRDPADVADRLGAGRCRELCPVGRCYPRSTTRCQARSTPTDLPSRHTRSPSPASTALAVRIWARCRGHLWCPRQDQYAVLTVVPNGLRHEHGRRAQRAKAVGTDCLAEGGLGLPKMFHLGLGDGDADAASGVHCLGGVMDMGDHVCPPSDVRSRPAAGVGPFVRWTIPGSVERIPETQAHGRTEPCSSPPAARSRHRCSWPGGGSVCESMTT